ncbi:MAG: histone deacetylase [Planctomycetota bacterium]
MRIYYTDHFELPLPEKHRFPMSKYRHLRERIVRSDDHLGDTLLVPPAATDLQLHRCHTERYVEAVKTGTLTPAEIRRIGFPWSPKMVERSRRSTGATIAACRAALEDGIAVNLAGGTHHAMSDAGEGYCVFNDAAVAIRELQSDGQIERACVIDLDVHQGNGTAEILGCDSTAFTLSIHGVKNFPLRKTAGDLDVALPDGTQDADYLSALQDALESVRRAGPFQLAVFLAGADPFEEDRLGRLSLTKRGLEKRDQTVLEWCQTQGIPVAIAMAGGYAEEVAQIVDIHASTVRMASRHTRNGRKTSFVSG